MGKHFDGWGHVTLGYLELVKRFSRDYPSLAAIRQLAPYKYVIMPDVEINVKKGRSDELDVVLYWPGETRRFCKKCDERSLDALRRLARSQKSGWVYFALPGGARFFRRGRVIVNKAATVFQDMLSGE